MIMDPAKTKELRRSFSHFGTWDNLISGDHNEGTYGPYSIVYGKTERSGTVRNETDETGWRKPSPYAVSSFEDVQFGGFANLQSKTQQGQPYIRQTVSGDNLHWSTQLATPRLTQPSVGYPDWLYQRAVNRALIDLKDSVVDYGIMLAEARKTADFVAHTARTALKALRLTKRGNLKGAAGVLGIDGRSFKNTFNIKRGHRRFDREMSKRWLELQYGWTPLMRDIQGVLADFEKGFLREPRIAVTKESRHTEKLKVPHQYWYGNSAYWLGSTDTEYEFICRVRLDYVLDADLVGLRQAAQKGVVSPLPAIWESIPWTFVSDWLVPVGEFLQTLDSSLGLTFKGGSWTTVTKARTIGQTRFFSGSPLVKADGQATGYITKYSMNRNVFEKEPSGGLYFKNPFSATHAISALALLNQFTNPKRRS